MIISFKRLLVFQDDSPHALSGPGKQRSLLRSGAQKSSVERNRHAIVLDRFGGVTQHMLRNTNVPLFLSH